MVGMAENYWRLKLLVRLTLPPDYKLILGLIISAVTFNSISDNDTEIIENQMKAPQMSP